MEVGLDMKIGLFTHINIRYRKLRLVFGVQVSLHKYSSKIWLPTVRRPWSRISPLPLHFLFRNDEIRDNP